jgi:hypothetical protein
MVEYTCDGCWKRIPSEDYISFSVIARWRAAENKEIQILHLCPECINKGFAHVKIVTDPKKAKVNE